MAKALSKTEMYIGQGDPASVAHAGDSFSRFTNLITSTGPDFSKADIEHTDMDSTAKEYFGDLVDSGNFAFTANRNFGTAGQAAARDLVQGQEQRNIRLLRKSTADGSTLETVEFIGEVMEWSEEASQGTAFTVSGRIKITEAVTFT